MNGNPVKDEVLKIYQSFFSGKRKRSWCFALLKEDVGQKPENGKKEENSLQEGSGRKYFPISDENFMIFEGNCFIFILIFNLFFLYSIVFLIFDFPWNTKFEETFFWLLTGLRYIFFTDGKFNIAYNLYFN